jgi:hypothetical protein
MTLLWALLKYVETKRKRWLVGIGATLGVLFTLSEMFPPTLIVLACVAPLLLLPEIKEAEERKALLKVMGIGTLVALVIVLILWPAGLFGGAWKMLKHYMDVAKIPVEFATLNGKQYDRAPKWAYLFWYWRDYRVYVLFYAGGFLGAFGLMAFRKGTREMATLLVYTLAFLAIAHAAHIIGPQYLVHCLPLLTLVAAILFCALATLWRPLAVLALLFCAGYMSNWDAQAHIEDPLAHAPRSAAAAQFLKTRWKPGTKMMIGTQYPTVLLWYMQKRARIPVKEREVYPFPSAHWKAVFLKRLVKGEFRYLVLANTFSPQVTVAPEIAKMLKGWKLVYKSAEPENATPRLRIYEWRKQ